MTAAGTRDGVALVATALGLRAGDGVRDHSRTVSTAARPLCARRQLECRVFSQRVCLARALDTP